MANPLGAGLIPFGQGTGAFNGDSNLSWDNTGKVLTAKNLVAAGTHRENYLINAHFDIWQRGSSYTQANMTGYRQYVADRWLFQWDGTLGTLGISRQPHSIGNGLEGEPEYCLLYNQTAAGTGTYRIIDQWLENIRTLAGLEVTLSFVAYASPATTITAQVFQYFGAGGSPTVYALNTNQNVTAAWTKYVFTFTIPGIAGKTIGAGSAIGVRLVLPVSGVYLVYFSSMRLERGGTATYNFRRPLAEELALCERYYEKSYDYATNPGTATLAGQTERYITQAYRFAESTVRFRVRKRVAPAVQLYNVNNGAAGQYSEYNSAGTFVQNLAGAVASSSEDGFFLYPGGNGTVGNYGRFQWWADADF